MPLRGLISWFTDSKIPKGNEPGKTRSVPTIHQEPLEQSDSQARKHLLSHTSSFSVPSDTIFSPFHLTKQPKTRKKPFFASLISHARSLLSSSQGCSDHCRPQSKHPSRSIAYTVFLRRTRHRKPCPPDETLDKPRRLMMNSSVKRCRTFSKGARAIEGWPRYQANLLLAKHGNRGGTEFARRVYTTGF